jgi:hypothetical protein
MKFLNENKLIDPRTYLFFFDRNTLPWICQNSQRHICNQVLLNQNTLFGQQPAQTHPNQPDIKFNMALDDMTIASKRG